MNKKDFIEDIKNNCSEILYISTKHILDKLYNDEDILVDKKDFFSNYKNYHLYLNDFAGTIYSKYATSVDNLYIEMCNFLDIDVDNKYTLEHTVIKLEKQTPQLLLSLTDEDIQKQTIEHFDEKLDAIYNSTHYQNNILDFKVRIKKLERDISLVKSVINR